MTGNHRHINQPHTLSRRDYIGSYLFEDNQFERYQLAEGYITPDGVYHAYIPDYQGNIVGVYNTSPNSITSIGSPLDQHTRYYPYGLPFADSGNPTVNRRKYGAKELTPDLGLNAYDFEARTLAPAFPMFSQQDPLAEKYYPLSPYLYCAGNPVNFIDPTGLSTRVEKLDDGCYQVIGGDLTDNDNNIYVYSADKNGQYTVKEQSIGVTTSITSFYNSDNGKWSDAIINTNDQSGVEFLSCIMNSLPTLDDYIINARTKRPYDFKNTNGTRDAIDGIDIYRGMPIGKTKNGQIIYTSARDIGNIAAGYVAAANGIPWPLARTAFDVYQSISSENLEIEGVSTQNAELYGWIMGYNSTTMSQKLNNLGNSVISSANRPLNYLTKQVSSYFYQKMYEVASPVCKYLMIKAASSGYRYLRRKVEYFKRKLGF
ncbi:MAG: RHS repeat domain-containing protein [Muribaculaceae bacterium]